MDLRRPLVLSVKRGRFRFDDPNASASDKAFKEVRSQVLERDHRTCQFCNFRAPKYQDVHHLNDNHDDNRPENLITTCVLCHMAHHVGFAGQSKRGTLIYLDPGLGMDQATLNQLVRTLWIAEASDEKAVRLHALTLLSRLYKAAVNARRVIGTSDPTVLGDFLLGLSEAQYRRRGEVLSGIYLLPLKEGYEQYIKFWIEHVYHGIPVRTWTRLAEQKHTVWAELGDE